MMDRESRTRKAEARELHLGAQANKKKILAWNQLKSLNERTQAKLVFSFINIIKKSSFSIKSLN